jgi:hypothetical protein
VSDFDSILNEQDDDAETPVETTEPVIEAAAESPALVESETSAPAPDAEEAQPITREDGATWSENAKRWYLGGKIVAGEAPAPSEPSIPKVEAPLAPVAEVPAPIAPIGEPWTVRGAGQKHAIPGAILTQDGKLVVEGPENIARHRDIVAAGIQHLTNYGREKQEWTQRVQQAEAMADAKAAKYNSTATMLYDILTDDEKLQRFINNLDDQRALLKDRISLHLEKADLKIPRAPQQAEQSGEEFETKFVRLYDSSLEELLDDAPKGLFTAEDVADLKAAYIRRINAYAVEHPQTKETVLDFEELQKDFAREVRLAQRAQAAAIKAAEDAKKAKAAAAFNAANTPKAPAPTPAKPRPTPALAAAPSGQKPSWDQSFKSAFRDDDDE